MTPDNTPAVDLAELRRLYEASTKGEWKLLCTHWGEAQIGVHDPTSDSTCSGIGPVKYICSRFNFDKNGWNDALFMAVAHNSLPEIFSKLDELAAAKERIAALVEVAKMLERALSAFGERWTGTDKAEAAIKAARAAGVTI